MRIVFFGSGSFGLPTLATLAAEHDVLAVISQPDRPAGRRRVLTPTPIAEHARDHNLTILRPENVNSASSIEATHAMEADAWVIIAYGQKLSPALLGDRFAINLHASLLPRWRGAAPIHHAVLAGDCETGVSVITLAERMDAGDVLGAVPLRIDPMDTTGELHERLAALGPALVQDVLKQYQTNTLAASPQDEQAVTLAPKISRSMARLDLSVDAISARNVINGCSPWPGVTVWIEGDRLRLLQGGESLEAAVPGRVTESGVLGCQSGAVQLLSVQPEGGKPMPFETWARGRRFNWPAVCLSDAP